MTTRRAFYHGTVLLIGIVLYLMQRTELRPTQSAAVESKSIQFKPKPNEFYSGYKKLQCRSCPEAAELGNPKAPLGFVIGVQKSGTTNLFHKLNAHPQVSGSDNFVELHYLSFQLNRKYRDHPGITKRCKVLQYYNDLLSDINAKGAGFLDKSPSYILLSHIVPQRLLCTFPNAKIILLLRNPIDRSFSHFHAMKRWSPQKHNSSEVFEQTLDDHLRSLRKAGLLNPHLTAREEHNLWTENVKPYDFVARGLYAIQIRQWMAVLGDHFGWDKIWDHFLILEAEEVWKDEEGYLNKISEFLGLSPFHFSSLQVPPKAYNSQLSNTTRERLEAIYRPHNRKLDDLLSPHGIHISWAKA